MDARAKRLVSSFVQAARTEGVGQQIGQSKFEYRVLARAPDNGIGPAALGELAEHLTAATAGSDRRGVCDRDAVLSAQPPKTATATRPCFSPPCIAAEAAMVSAQSDRP